MCGLCLPAFPSPHPPVPTTYPSPHIFYKRTTTPTCVLPHPTFPPPPSCPLPAFPFWTTCSPLCPTPPALTCHAPGMLLYTFPLTCGFMPYRQMDRMEDEMEVGLGFCVLGFACSLGGDSPLLSVSSIPLLSLSLSLSIRTWSVLSPSIYP